MEFSIDNTIMKVTLSKPMLPHTDIEIGIEFRTYFDNKGTMRRRMKTFEHDGVKQFDGVHWYPRICVYDRKFGLDQGPTPRERILWRFWSIRCGINHTQ